MKTFEIEFILKIQQGNSYNLQQQIITINANNKKEALTALQLRRTNIGYGKKDDIDRLYHAISLVIYDNVSTSNSESALMNS